MGNILISLVRSLCCGFRSRASLLAEILALRHQLTIVKRSSKKRPRLGRPDRLLWYGSAVFGPTGEILESQPQLVQDWTKERSSPGGGRGALLEALRGRGGRGRGGAAGSTMANRKGEATVAISLPLKTLKKGTYTLQIHVRDLIVDVNLFRRVPIVIQ